MIVGEYIFLIRDEKRENQREEETWKDEHTSFQMLFDQKRKRKEQTISKYKYKLVINIFTNYRVGIK